MIEQPSNPFAITRRPVPVGSLDGTGILLDRFGNVVTRPTGSDSATVTRVAATVVTTTLVGATGPVYLTVGNRMGVAVYNDSTADLYLKIGTGATTTDFTVKVPPDGYYETPYGIAGKAITGVWSAAVGAAQVTVFERDGF